MTPEYLGAITALVTALLTGIGGFVAGLYAVKQSARKSELEVLRITINELVADNTRLRSRIEELERDFSLSQSHNTKLIQQLVSNGIAPVSAGENVPLPTVKPPSKPRRNPGEW